MSEIVYLSVHLVSIRLVSSFIPLMRKRGSVRIFLTRSSLHIMVLSLVVSAKIAVAYLIQTVDVQWRLTTMVG